jgi:hypothetical protein
MAEHFFIAGAQRSATTYLYRMLEQHPDITLAQPVRPEPKYFIRDGFSGDLEAYHREFFDQAGTPWFGEKSTSYIEHPVAAERIARCLPDAVIFFMLRDPVERALSNYRFSVMNGLESSPLAQALDAEASRVADGAGGGTSVSPFSYVGRGHYVRYLEKWQAYFPRRQLRLLVTEDVVGSRQALDRVFESLGLAPGVPLRGMDVAVNDSSHDASVDIDPALRARLRDTFASSNRELAETWGVDIGSWQ